MEEAGKPLVACAVWGDWPGSRQLMDNRGYPGYTVRGGNPDLQAKYILNLKKGVERFLPIPHDFICFTDDLRKVPTGVRGCLIKIPKFTRCIAKAWIYGAPFSGCPLEAGRDCLLLDLDNVIVGDLRPFFEHSYEMVAREVLRVGWEHIPDGDIVFFRTGSDKCHRVANIVRREVEEGYFMTDGGDERLILQEAGADCWAQVCPRKIYSYRLHACRTLPPTASIVSFHGNPLPDQADASWIKEYWE